ncbi:MAG: metallophosphoesterase family protein [Bacilli bacterium]|nr:metallophosphoesterase family protein [Bacilli bacterium]
MSKIGVISDIHANIDALELVLKDMEKNGVDEIICLGDLVTKYFYPKECVDAIKENCSIVVKGNCDDLVANDERYKYARGKLGLSRIEYLDNLPITYKMKINNAFFNMFHATPNSLDKIFNPLFSKNELTPYKDKIITDPNEMFMRDNEIVVCAHTHQSYIGRVKNNEFKLLMNNIILEEREKIIINVGSAGEHSHMTCFNNKVDTIIDPILTYLTIENINAFLYARIKYVPYKETLKKVYLDILKKERESLIPYSPRDKEKIEKSLKLMR